MDQFGCIACTETLYGRPYAIANDKVCGDCVFHVFDAAIEHEANFPPKWGDTVLDPEHYREVLNPAYMQRYAQRKQEWAIEALDRVYCNAGPRGAAANCGNFLGNRSGQMVLVQCDKCQAWTCRHCRELVAGGRNANHRCDPNVERQDRTRAFEGLERGRHYQKCPRCDRQYALGDGCHHVQCGHPCMAWFCFTCGAECSDGYDHFSERMGDGKCELYPPRRNEHDMDFGGVPAAPPFHDPGTVADLEGVFGARGNVGADLRREQEDIMIGFGGGANLAGPARQLGQAPALWRNQAPQAGPRDPFAAFRVRYQGQNAGPGGGNQQALVHFAGGAQIPGGGQDPVRARPGGDLPIDGRLEQAFQVLGRGVSRLLALLEFYSDNADDPLLVTTRVLHNDLQNRWRLAQRSAAEQSRMYQWAVNQYRQLINLRDDEWTARVIQVAFTQHLWVQWIGSNAEDPRVDRITAIATARRPGGLFEQQPNFGDQMLGDQLRGLLGEANAGNIGQQAGGNSHEHRELLGQRSRNMPGGMDGQQAGPGFVHAGGLQPQDIRTFMPREIAGG